MLIFVLIIVITIFVYCQLKKVTPYTPPNSYVQESLPEKKVPSVFKNDFKSPTPLSGRIASEVLTTFKYDINNMLFLYHCDPDEDVYGVPHMYWDTMAEDILQANTFLDEAAQKCSTIPNTRINKEDINFKPNRQLDDNFTRFVYSPFTKTGKISKYPYHIKFSLSGEFSGEKCLFGDIYFTKQNQIGKMWLVSWFNHKCYTINCAIKDKYLQVTRIDVSTADNYSKTCLYNYNK